MTVYQNRIRTTWLKLRGLSFLLMVAIPTLIIWYWLYPFNSILGTQHIVEDLVEVGFLSEETLSLSERLLAILVSFLPALLLMFGTFQMARLFGFFASGHYDSLEAIRTLRVIALCLIAYAPTAVAHRTLLGYALTVDNLPGERLFFASAELGYLVVFFVGIILWMIASAFRFEKNQPNKHSSTT